MSIALSNSSGKGSVLSFKRPNLPDSFAVRDELTRNLVAIGFLFAEHPSQEEPNIEHTLVAASIEGLAGDYRALSLLVDWIPIHFDQVNVDLLVKIVKALPDKKIKAFWSSIGKWQGKDPRLKRLARIYRGPRLPILDEKLIRFPLQRDGEDTRFLGTNLIVPGRMLRHRPKDIADCASVARNHLGYRYRLIIGPTYRADMWAALERHSTLTPSDLARKCYGSFSTAWNVRKDWEVIRKIAV